MEKTRRCKWVTDDPLYIDYHDNEWGQPLHDDQALFGMLMLEGMQAGLSWITILKRRSAYQKAFSNFDPVKIARFTDKKLEKLLQDPALIRNRLKIYAWRQNAKAYLQLQKELGSFSDYLWSFVNNKPIKNSWKKLADIPAQTDLSKQLSKDLKKRGFTFVGPTICYAFMQAVGLVNDHEIKCEFR